MEGYNNCDHIYSFSQDQNVGNLFLGDYNSAKNKRIHRNKGITTIITAGLGMKVAPSSPIKHHLYPLYDSPSENIEKFFQQAFDQIEIGLQNGNVLVHCFAGVSRSTTIVISFLMKKMKWSFKQTLEHVRKQRWVINPNPGFVRQLRRYENKLKNSVNPEIQKAETTFFSTTFRKTNAVDFSKTEKIATMNRNPVRRGNSLGGQKINNLRSVNFSLVKR